MKHTHILTGSKTLKFRLMSILSNRRRLDERISNTFDTFRWLSAFAVCAGHAAWVFYSSSLDHVNPWGFAFGLLAQASVMMFFVLSGFFIFKSFSSSIVGNRVDLISYGKKRINRLYPPLILSILISILIYYISPYFFATGSRFFIDNGFLARESLENTAWSFIGTAFFVNGLVTTPINSNPSLWSLPYEFWYYASICAAPFLYKRSVIFVSLILVCISLVFFKVLLLYSIVWYSGALLAIMHNYNYKIPTKKILSVILIAMFASIYFGYNHYLSSNNFEVQTNLPTIPLYNTAIGILFFGILHLILTERIGAISYKPKLSSFSYTAYIIHMPIMFMIYGSFQNYFISMHRGLLFIFSLFAACSIFWLSKKISFVEEIKIFQIK